MDERGGWILFRGALERIARQLEIAIDLSKFCNEDVVVRGNLAALHAKRNHAHALGC